MKKTITPEQIDDLLPQTQCGLCGYGGCMPYANAIAFENESLNLCPPGGINTLRNLGNLLNQDISLFIPDMERKQKPDMQAKIREAECIGCTKCIQACPVDAIVGTSKQMHVVITDVCTGCELCVPPCPVDCIDMISMPPDENLNDKILKKEKSNQSRLRFQAREKRLAKEKLAKKNALKNISQKSQSQIQKLNYIAAALARVKIKKKI